MKASFYNFEFPYDENSNKIIFYNSRTNALALIESEKHKQYKDFCSSGVAIADEKLVEELTWEELRKEVPPKTFIKSAVCD